MPKFKKRVFDIMQIGKRDDLLSYSFDVFIVVVIFTNLFVTLYSTFDSSVAYKGILDTIELITVLIFTVEYVLRIWTSDLLFPQKGKIAAVFSFIFSFYGIIDLLTFFPYYLPFMFPAGAVAFRMLRVIRIFRLFKINAQYDAFNVITTVLKEKKKQLMSSIVLIMILMIASSLCMYSLENAAQPDVFKNAFSGIWWASSTLLTVGYGDIYPITIGGKIMGIVIAFLGVGMVAIPTGIISAGFVEQYTKIKQAETLAEERELKFITSAVTKTHPWCKKMVKDIVFPPSMLLVMIVRNGEIIVPKGDTLLLNDDICVFGGRHYKDPISIDLKEIEVKSQNPWVGCAIKDLDISQLELIVMIQRQGKSIIPNGNTVIHSGDTVIMYSRHGKIE